MRKIGLAAPALLLLMQCPAFGRGVSPYLPLDLDPEIEAQIERVLILGNKPVMTRPIPAATVLEALPKACKVDQGLCERVQRYLSRYMHNRGVSYATLEGAASSGKGAASVAPNRYGMEENSHWDASAQVYLQPNDYVLIDLGAVAYEGRTTFSGSMISLGFSGAQLDFGFRPHWFSPFSDSSMLMSTEAPTMPSVTLSNYEPLTRLGLRYELFEAIMSNSNRIVFDGGYTSGKPRLAGVHVDAEPVSGWSIGVSRLLQYGGGALGGSSVRDLLDAFFSPSATQKTSVGQSAPFGNQEASVTSSLLFPGKVPFSVYFEYAGEDTSRGKDYLLGNSSLSAGIHFPRVWGRLDLTLETSEWQNAWYVHDVYLDGLTNYGRVIGNWFGDQRVFGDGVGGQSQMASLGWDSFGGHVQLRYRTLQNQQYGAYGYHRFQDAELSYSRPWKGVLAGAQLDAGRDVFGGNFARLAAFVRYDENRGLGPDVGDSFDGSGESREKAGEIFIDAGVNYNQMSTDLTSPSTRTKGARELDDHFAVGARRFVSQHSDLGTRIETDGIQGHNLVGVRLLDYRYRFEGPMAASVFLGAARYNLATPAYGFYYGAGVQWRNLFPGWDLGADIRYADSVARDHLLPSDPHSTRPDSFYNITSLTLSISRHF